MTKPVVLISVRLTAEGRSKAHPGLCYEAIRAGTSILGDGAQVQPNEFYSKVFESNE